MDWNVYHGFCEYQFQYKDSSTLYVSTDIYYGGKPNSVNRASIGINTYAIERSAELVDTFSNSGVQENGKCWMEEILGNYVVGYVNVHPDNKGKINSSLKSINLNH